MKPDSGKEEMKADSTTRKHPHVEPVGSQEHTMDSASDCKFIYSTPQVGKTDSDTQESVSLTVRSSYSVDSGISDTFNSTWASGISDVSSLSAECSPQPQPDNKRLALKACEFSPIKRVLSTCIQGRRLTFTEAVFQAVGLSTLERDASERETLCEKSVRSQELDEVSVRQTDTLPVLPSEQAHCQSCFSSPDSAIGESLEISIQEMALKEFSPDIDCTPLNFKSRKYDNGEHLRMCHKQKYKLHGGSRTFLKCCSCPHCTSDSFRDKSVERISRCHSSQTETPLKYSPYTKCRHPISSDIFYSGALHHRADVQRKFDDKVSLIPASQQTPHKLERAASEPSLPNMTGSEHSNAAAQSLLDRISPDVEQRQTCADLTGSRPCQQHTLPWSIAHLPNCCDSAVKCNFDRNGLTLSQSQTLNPSKRSSDCTQVCCFPFGPPKVRRTHMLVNQERASVVHVPRDCSSGELLDKSFVSDCDTLKEDIHLYNSSGSHFADQIQIEEDKISCDIQLQKSDTLLFHSFHGKYNQATEQEAACDSFNGEHLKRCLQKLQKLRPGGPTHLIGDNVGIGKFDIVYELYQQNFLLCLEVIFSHLADCDLASIVAVSTRWKLALYSEHKAYTRYRQHKRSLSVRNLQHVFGKENTAEKPSSAPSSSQTLTQPRGLLCSIQSQAETKAAPEPPSTAGPKDVLMCDDTLRTCPHCQGPAMVKPCQDRATCMSNKCAYDFCTLCFTTFHHPRPCKPLYKAPSRAEVAGTKKSKKNLKRL